MRRSENSRICDVLRQVQYSGLKVGYDNLLANEGDVFRRRGKEGGGPTGRSHHAPASHPVSRQARFLAKATCARLSIAATPSMMAAI